MNAELKYECTECGDIYDDSHEAAHCCPQFYEVYQCGHCHKSFSSSEDAADDCCEDVDKDAKPMITHAELEAAGQLIIDFSKQ